jgi:Aspartyl/Asparaginyl beta-hydroxylase
MSRKSLWEHVVQWTIAAGERILVPVERFIGRRSLVGDATFFPLERFPWVKHVEDNWTVIREELERVLDDHAGLANFQDISKDQIEITDDDRWKTFFIYGYGVEAKLGIEMCPRTAALMREIPGMKTAMISILSPRKHILDHRGPYKGVLRYHLGLIVPEDARVLPHPRRRGHPPLGGGQEHGLRRHVQPRGVERHRRDARGAVRGRPTPAPPPRVADQPRDRQGDRVLAVRARCQAQPGSLGTALSGAPLSAHC